MKADTLFPILESVLPLLTFIARLGHFFWSCFRIFSVSFEVLWLRCSARNLLWEKANLKHGLKKKTGVLVLS